MSSKRLRGQFFTTTNPFNVDPFHKWLKTIPGYKQQTFLEPFAGANNIVVMLADLGYGNHWACFDIEPANKDLNASGFEVSQRDTLDDYPEGFTVAITNPPYLAKNSATRRGLPFPETIHDDLYKVALDAMLSNTQYVAAIIPESYITQNLFHDRLQTVISLTCRMFEDTEVPVCLALFVPAETKAQPLDFSIYAENRLIGAYSELQACLEIFHGEGLDWRFNDPQGQIGLYAVDSTKGDSIQFVSGDEIDSCLVLSTSRSVTRISSPLDAADIKRIIKTANELLKVRRKKTKDAFMTSFKGLRRDGRYRRRLDFKQARELLNLAAQKVGVI